MVTYQPIYTITEAATLLRISEARILQIINEGFLPYILLNSEMRIRGIDLESYINSRTLL